jgi:hypothetical protein
MLNACFERAYRERERRSGDAMSMHTALERLGAALRRIWICEAARPELTILETLWGDLPAGRPDGLGLEMRYLLGIYRAALAERDTLRRWLVTHHAEMWLLAAEAEAALLWQIEAATLGDLTQIWDDAPEALPAVA